jgi:hypothetical protein
VPAARSSLWRVRARGGGARWQRARGARMPEAALCLWLRRAASCAAPVALSHPRPGGCAPQRRLAHGGGVPVVASCLRRRRVRGGDAARSCFATQVSWLRGWRERLPVRWRVPPLAHGFPVRCGSSGQAPFRQEMGNERWSGRVAWHRKHASNRFVLQAFKRARGRHNTVVSFQEWIWLWSRVSLRCQGDCWVKLTRPSVGDHRWGNGFQLHGGERLLFCFLARFGAAPPHPPNST